MLAQQHNQLVPRLYERSGAARWGVSRERFGEALERSVAKTFREAADPRPDDIRAHLESLHVTDLALACACAEGVPAAWDHFIAEFRPGLYATGRAMTHDEPTARELADSLYAELYGLEEREGRRRSLFEYFHGRSTLATWLRSVLAQRHVDRIRETRRLVSFDDTGGASASAEFRADPERGPATFGLRRPGAGTRADPALGASQPADPDRRPLLGLFLRTLSACIAALAPADRLRLSYYYLHDLTLAQIGRLLHEHESSVSRKLERARRALRAEVERRLRDDHRLGEADIRQCYEDALSGGAFDLGRLMKECCKNEAPARSIQGDPS